MTRRRKFTGHFKAQVALEALRGDRTIQEIGSKHNLHPNQVSQWKKQAVAGLGSVFGEGAGLDDDHEAEVKELHAKIGKLSVDNDFLSHGLGLSTGYLSGATSTRKAMIGREAGGPSVTRQCELLSISRSSVYTAPVGESAATLALMRRTDALFTKYTFFGSRQIVHSLRREGIAVGRHRVRRLMRLMGLTAVYRRPKTSQPHPQHRIYPYLLRKLAINQANQVWCADITYIPVRRGFLYLVAIMDWATRKVLAWRVSNTMDAGFWVEALQSTLARYDPPEIMNTDQGSQFTSADWITTLSEAGVRISMDERCRFTDNIFIERLWRSLKYEAIYLQELTDGFHAGTVIDEWMEFYNTDRPHSVLDGQTPDDRYWRKTKEPLAA